MTSWCKMTGVEVSKLQILRYTYKYYWSNDKEVSKIFGHLNFIKNKIQTAVINITKLLAEVCFYDTRFVVFINAVCVLFLTKKFYLIKYRDCTKSVHTPLSP